MNDCNRLTPSPLDARADFHPSAVIRKAHLSILHSKCRENGSHCTPDVQKEEQMGIRSIWRGCGAFLAVGLFALPAAAGPHMPKITDVALSGSAGNYTAVITGTNFGVAPDGIPCNTCTPLQLQVVDLASQPHQETINVTAWSDTSITVTGIAASEGDGLRIALYNQTAGNVDAWGGRVGRKVDGVPHITSITTSGSGGNLTVKAANVGVVTIQSSGSAPTGACSGDTFIITPTDGKGTWCNGSTYVNKF